MTNLCIALFKLQMDFLYIILMIQELYKEDSVFMPILHMTQLGLREIQFLAQGCTDRKLQATLLRVP